MSMRATTWECVCVTVCVYACVFSIHPSPRSLQKTKTTAVKGIMPEGNGREKLPITQTQTYTYAPCHDVHPDIPSQLLTPHAQPAQVDILHKHTHIKNIQTVCKNRCSDRSLCLCCFFPRQVSLLLSTILTLCVLFSHFLSSRREADTTHLLVTRRQMEKDYSASSIFI